MGEEAATESSRIDESKTELEQENPEADRTLVEDNVGESICPDSAFSDQQTEDSVVEHIDSGTDAAAIEQPLGESAVVEIPSGVTNLGVSFSGVPPRIRQVQEDSPLNGRIHSGQIVEGVSVPNHVDILGIMTSLQLKAVLNNYPDEHDRRIYLTTNIATAAHHTRLKITLPAGSIKMEFSGTPPVVDCVAEDSPFCGIVRQGLQVESLQIIDDEFRVSVSDLTSEHLEALLLHYAHRQDRVLLLKKRPRQVSQTEQDANARFALDRNVWGPGVPTPFISQTQRTPWYRRIRTWSRAERVQFGSYLVLVILLVVGMVLMVSVYGNEGGFTPFVLIVAFAFAGVMVNLSWQCQKVGKRCSDVQIVCNLFILVIMVTSLFWIDCDDVDQTQGEGWCATMYGIVCGGGSCMLVLINLPSCFVKERSRQDDATDAESFSDSSDGEEVLQVETLEREEPEDSRLH